MMVCELVVMVCVEQLVVMVCVVTLTVDGPHFDAPFSSFLDKISLTTFPRSFLGQRQRSLSSRHYLYQVK